MSASASEAAELDAVGFAAASASLMPWKYLALRFGTIAMIRRPLAAGMSAART